MWRVCKKKKKEKKGKREEKMEGNFCSYNQYFFIISAS